MANDRKTFTLYVHTGLEEDRKYIIQFILLKNQGGYKTETAVSLQQFCLQIQLDFDNLLGPLY